MAKSETLPEATVSLMGLGVHTMSRFEGKSRRKRKRLLKRIDRSYERMDRLSRTTPLFDAEDHETAVAEFQLAWAWWRAARRHIARL